MTARSRTPFERLGIELSTTRRRPDKVSRTGKLRPPRMRPPGSGHVPPAPSAYQPPLPESGERPKYLVASGSRAARAASPTGRSPGRSHCIGWTVQQSAKHPVIQLQLVRREHVSGALPDPARA